MAPRARIANVAAALACVAAIAAGCVTAGVPPTSSAHRPDGTVRSNVTRNDYVGSAACARCHADVAAEWERSPMHRMTREARGATVRAPFDGTEWHFKADAVVLERRGDDRFVRVEPSGGAPTTYRVTRIIGGRTREDFAGVDVQHSGGTRDPGDEVILPVSYVFATHALRYKGYSVMIHERATLRAGPVWSKTCLFCHNTIPEMDRFLGAIAGRGARPYQGQTVDRWLPVERRARVRVTDVVGFAEASSEETSRFGGVVGAHHDDAGSIARQTIDSVRSGFDGADLVEVGIGCEACHGGSREHANDPRVRTSFVPTAPWLGVDVPSEGRAHAIDRACARCHQVLFSQYPFTWEGGRRDAIAGGSHINSGEARDFLLGGCASALSCTTCHDPHRGDDSEKMRALATPAGNPTCTRCHADLADRDRLRAHAHHDPDAAGGACIACHMPRKNMGLAGALTRYHRIGSPTDAARVLGDRPIECALCHADRTVGALVEAMEAWWPVRYPRQRLEQLYGSLDSNVMRATLERGKPHERAVAIATFDEGRVRSAAPLVARSLVDDYPLVREWALHALVSILGRCDVDLGADDPTIARAAAACAGAPLPLPVVSPRDEEAED